MPVANVKTVLTRLISVRRVLVLFSPSCQCIFTYISVVDYLDI